MAALTSDDLARDVKGYSWDVLTDGNPGVAERCISKARVWLMAKMKAARGVYDEDDEIQRLILIKRALYELYSHAEQEAVAQDKKEDAMELLKAHLGSAVDSSGYQAGGTSTPLPCGAIRHDQRKP